MGHGLIARRGGEPRQTERMPALVLVVLVVTGLLLMTGRGWYARRIGTESARRQDRAIGVAMLVVAAVLMVARLVS